ncbi:MAG TPA: PH domain-containing protein [Fimbriimonadaceae bacterium]|nr:PH domain-containing protein [Fimbriimonadaceae bacterium]HRJ33780.1 PH domain-containing protein [Fimbriimonadaceae bacterium]
MNRFEPQSVPLAELKSVEPPLDPRFKGLPRKVLTVWRVSTVLGVLGSAILFFPLELTLRRVVARALDLQFLGFTGSFTLLILALLTPYALYVTKRSYENWRFLVRDDDVLIYSGFLSRTLQCIPRIRIQHVDIQSGPIDRMLGLTQVTLHTAGGALQQAKIPGLTAADAERLRDELLIKVVPPPAP